MVSTPENQGLTADERRLLLRLARAALTSAVQGESPPTVSPETLPPALRELRACFVTLTNQGALRGCIGQVRPHDPLYEAVIRQAGNAGLRDPRFEAVTPDELADLSIEVSVLTEPQPLAFASPEELLATLRPHRDGVWLQIGARTATFLPQVWEQVPRPEEFLSRLSQKAGCQPAAWRGAEVRVSIYQSESFYENPAG